MTFRQKKSATAGDRTVWHLMRRNISVAQLAGYAVAALLGLAILMTAMQFFRDVTHARDTDDGLISRDYLVVSKKVSGALASFFTGGGDTSFTPEEVADIERQPWARKVGRFTSADFNVAAAVELGGRGMSTYLFFESIPDEFFDVRPQGWDFDPERPEVPIILSKDYLALYNFGFAASRGLPQLSESTVELIPLRVSVSGNGRQQWLPARIAGFSSRLNTIAVPEAFMQWANANFAEPGGSNPSRLIIEADATGDPEIGKYLARHGYEAAGDREASEKATYLVSVSSGVVGVIGIVISLLALFILLLSVWLLLHKNRDKIHQLLLLGYTPSEVARYYYIIIAAINGAVCLGALIFVTAAQHWWSSPLEAIGAHPSSLWPTMSAAVIVMTAVTAINVAAIRHTVTSRFFTS